MVKIIHRAWKRSVMSELKRDWDDEVSIPVMPLDQNQRQMVHRCKIRIGDDVFNTMVVRTLKRKEMMNTPGAMKAMDDEFNKLSK
eukprot:14727571-Heterocapsa_arctica.AAC.1